MTQDTSSQPTVMEHALEPLLKVESPAQQPEAYADDLMDEIFGEVEQVLDGSLIPPDEPVTVGVKPSTPLDIVEALGDRYSLLIKPPAESAPPELPGPDKELSRISDSRESMTKSTTGLSLLERFMIFTGCASAVGALAIWLVSQGFITRGVSYVSQAFAPTPSTSAPAAIPVGNPVDITFSEYMLRSLAAIDRETNPNSPVESVAPISALGAVAGNATVTIPPPQSPLQLNQIATQSTGTKPVAVPSIDAAAKPDPATATAKDLVTRTELNQVMNRISAMLEGIAPSVTERSVANSTTQSKPVKPSSGQSTTLASLPKRRISGVVEWGDKSVVTIEYNGATQRVYLGEVVGDTGWTLVTVQGNQATFRKNGKFRSLSDGESF